MSRALYDDSMRKTFLGIVLRVGTDTAHTWLQSLTDEASSRTSTPKLTPKKEKELEGAVEALMESGVRPIRSAGRPTDPTSARQRIWSEVTAYLRKHPQGADIYDIFSHVAVKTGLTYDKVRVNANQLQGVQRSYGKWKLAA